MKSIAKRIDAAKAANRPMPTISLAYLLMAGADPESLSIGDIVTVGDDGVKMQVIE